MSIFRELGQMYGEIDSFYARREFEANKKRWAQKEKAWARKRELNDHAYFLFMFTRLEGHIRERSSKLITSKQTNLRQWKQRRVWDILPKDKDADRPYFKDRLALLVEKGSKDYNTVAGYYRLRNELGHGGGISAVPFLYPTWSMNSIGYTAFYQPDTQGTDRAQCAHSSICPCSTYFLLKKARL